LTDILSTIRLEECTEVLPGFSVRGRIAHDPSSTHQLLLTRHLREGVQHAYPDDDELRINPGRDAGQYELRAGDVLFMSRGTLNRAWVLESIPDHTLAPVSFYILRPRDGVDGAYLAWYLNQAPAQAGIDQIRTGAGTPLVQRAAFLEIEVALPSLAVQREVAALGGLLARERDLRERISAATNRLHSGLGRAMIEQMRQDGRNGANQR